MRNYATARSLYSFLEFLAWSMVIGGGILAIAGAGMAEQAGSSGFGRSSGTNPVAMFIAAVPGVVVCIFGILLAAMIQSGRANVDAAEMTGKMLVLAEESLKLQKTQQQTQSFATASARPATGQSPTGPAPAGVSHGAARPAVDGAAVLGTASRAGVVGAAAAPRLERDPSAPLAASPARDPGPAGANLTRQD